MKCPVCANKTLKKTEILPNLDAQTCPACEGVWISSLAYFAWLRSLNASFPDRPVGDAAIHPEANSSAKICPECGHLLRRYKVIPNTDFYLDHCSSCNGTWMDHGEWQTIETLNLQDNLHTFFTRPWQEKIRGEEVRAAFEKIYREKFGAHDYAEIRRIRTWMRQHPQSQMLLAYLQSEDPYRM